MHFNEGKKHRKANNGFFIGIVSALFTVYLSGLLFTGHVQLIVFYIYAAVSSISFTAYYVDKNAAERGKWRIQESTLHIMALFCGWPGAYAAQRFTRHKIMKEPFQRIFVVCVILNILGFILYSSSTALCVILGLMGWT